MHSAISCRVSESPKSSRWAGLMASIGFGRNKKHTATNASRGLRVEPLEDRRLLSVLIWDPNGAAAGVGGTGTWNTTSAYWRLDTVDGPLQAWQDGSDAVFPGSSGTVTINPSVSSVSANSISFQTTGYTVGASSGKSLLLPAGGTTIDVASGLSATFNSAAKVTGSGGLTKTGSGMLTLTNTASDFTGALTISNGTVRAGGTGVIPDAAAVSITSSGTLDVYGKNETIGSLSGSGTVRNDGNYPRTLTVNQTVDGTFSGTIVNGISTLNLEKQGIATLTLSGANTYTGTTNISDGALGITSVDNLGSATSAITIEGGAELWITDTLTLNRNVTLGTGGGTLDVDADETLTMAGAITGANTLTKTGAGTLILNATNTYSHGTVVDDGLLQLGSSGTLGTGSLTNDGVLDLNGHNVIVTALNNESYPGTITNSSSITDVTLTVNQTTDTAYGGSIDDGVNGHRIALAKTGGGILELDYDNTYSGGTTVAGGTLLINSSYAIGPETAALIITGGELDLNYYDITVGSLSGTGGSIVDSYGGSTLIVDQSVDTTYSGRIGTTLTDSVDNCSLSLRKTGTGTLTLAGTGINKFYGGFTLDNGKVVVGKASALGGVDGYGEYSGDVVINGGILDLNGHNIAIGTLIGYDGVVTNLSTTADADLTVYLLYDGEFYGSIDNGPYHSIRSLTIDDYDFYRTLTLGGANNFSPNITIKSGSLMLDSNSALTNAGDVVLGTSAEVYYATLNLNGYNTTIDSLSGYVGATITTMDTAVLTVNQSASKSFHGDILDGVRLVKQGAGTLTLYGGNDYTEGTVVNAGILRLAVDSTFGGCGNVTVNGGQLDLAGFEGYDVTLNNVTVNGGTLNIGGAAVTTEMLSGTGGTITDTVGGGILNVQQSDNASYLGVLAGTLALNLNAYETDTVLTLGSQNTYSGGTMISEGVLRFVNGALGSGPIMFDGGTLQWATGNTQDVSARIDLPDSYTGAIIDTNGNNVIFSTAITDVPVSVGFVDLTKTGDGTLTLAAANTYTGDTVISGGNLYVTGSVAGKVIIGGTVLSSATLSGTGTVGDVTVGAYGILSPGSLSGGGIGTLTTGNLAFTGGANSFYRADIANGTPACDTINVHGTVTLGGATLDIYGSRNRLINEALKLILNDGTDETSGTFAGLTEGSTLSVGGVDYDVSYLFNGDAGGTANDLALLTL